eukprot:COSAG01_NODE_1228_length_11129_cov_184.387851_4_plen_102_part_00
MPCIATRSRRHLRCSWRDRIVSDTHLRCAAAQRRFHARALVPEPKYLQLQLAGWVPGVRLEQRLIIATRGGARAGVYTAAGSIALRSYMYSLRAFRFDEVI